MLKSVREELLPLFWELAHSSLFVAHTGQTNVRAFFQLDAICRAQKFANIYDGISALVICSRIPFGERMNAFQFNLLEYSEDVNISNEVPRCSLHYNRREFYASFWIQHLHCQL